MDHRIDCIRIGIIKMMIYSLFLRAIMLSFCCFTFHSTAVVDGAYIFGFLLHNPIPDENSRKILSSIQSSPRAQVIPDEDSFFTSGENQTDSSSLIQSDQMESSHSRSLQSASSKLNEDDHDHSCSSDKECLHLLSQKYGSSNLYCDTHYGKCSLFKSRGDLCRRDEECSGSNICIFGKCDHRIPNGMPGSRCSSNHDCSSDHCCARQHGEKICKPMLGRNQKCFVPFGGLDYSLNEMCPCQTGLTCILKLNENRKKQSKK